MAAHPEERAARPHPRPEPIGRGELPPVHRRDHRRPRPQRPARRRDEDLGRAARRRGEEADDPPRGHRGARRVEEVAHARGVREAGPARGAGRPPGVPRAEGASTCRSTSARSRRSSRTKGMFFEPGRDRRAAGLRRLGARRPSRACRSRWSTRRATASPNVVMLHGPSGTIPPKMPKSVSLPVQRAGQGDPPPQRRERLGVPGGPRGDRLDDRPPPLRRTARPRTTS